MKKNYKMVLTYDGTNYSGWQKQKNARTVCAEVESALSTVARTSAELIGVSRTDAGVHAVNYVANVFLDTETPPEKLLCGTNALLPDDISLKSIEECDESFNARYDVKSKTYVYTIDNSPYGNVFLRKYAWRFKYNLDIEKMKRAAKYIEGTHDFSSFMSQGGSAKTFVRTIYECNVDKIDDTIKIYVCGDGFLYNMVRIITGTLVWAGLGKINPDSLPAIIKSKNRKNAGVTAPPEGLALYELKY